MKLYARKPSGRYRDATPGEIVTETLAALRRKGLEDVAEEMSAKLFSHIGYTLPHEPEEIPEYD